MDTFRGLLSPDNYSKKIYGIALSSVSTQKAINMLSIVLRYLPLLATLGHAVHKPLPPGQAIGETTNVTIVSSGINRTYLISIPPKYDCETITPVIFSFHGGNRNASQQQELSQFSNPEFNDFAIAVYPLGIGVWYLISSAGVISNC